MATPFVPGGAGAAIKAARTADKATDALRAMKRGIESEKRVLRDMGLEKNTRLQKVKLKGTEEPVTVIPDAITKDRVIEIKDAKAVYNTRQIKGEIEYAKQNGKQFELVIGEKTHVSSEISKDETIIITRRKDLGPQ